MKVGLSYSRCVRDIVEGKVDIDDVLVIIARTDFDPNNDQQWESIWYGYANMSTEWGDTKYAENDFRTVSLALWNQGKLHQPRKFGAYPRRRNEYWLETCLPSEELNRNSAAKAAWENFQVIARLTNVTLDTKYQ